MSGYENSKLLRALVDLKKTENGEKILSAWSSYCEIEASIFNESKKSASGNHLLKGTVRTANSARHVSDAATVPLDFATSMSALGLAGFLSVILSKKNKDLEKSFSYKSNPFVLLRLEVEKLDSLLSGKSLNNVDFNSAQKSYNRILILENYLEVVKGKIEGAKKVFEAVDKVKDKVEQFNQSALNTTYRDEAIVKLNPLVKVQGFTRPEISKKDSAFYHDLVETILDHPKKQKKVYQFYSSIHKQRALVALGQLAAISLALVSPPAAVGVSLAAKAFTCSTSIRMFKHFIDKRDVSKTIEAMLDEVKADVAKVDPNVELLIKRINELEGLKEPKLNPLENSKLSAEIKKIGAQIKRTCSIYMFCKKKGLDYADSKSDLNKFLTTEELLTGVTEYAIDFIAKNKEYASMAATESDLVSVVTENPFWGHNTQPKRFIASAFWGKSDSLPTPRPGEPGPGEPSAV